LLLNDEARRFTVRELEENVFLDGEKAGAGAALRPKAKPVFFAHGALDHESADVFASSKQRAHIVAGPAVEMRDQVAGNRDMRAAVAGDWAAGDRVFQSTKALASVSSVYWVKGH
jgi:hypothetical protein